MTETKLNSRVSTGGTHRVGTIHADRALLLAALGEPHELDGDKTTMEWFFETPAGPATLYDYWWNAPGEWSIGGHSEEVVQHMEAFLKNVIGS